MEEQVINPDGNFGTIIERSQNYAMLSFEITKLKGLNTTATVVTTLLSRFSVILVMSFFVLIVSLGGAFWIGEVLGKIYYGFFIIAGFYFLVGLMLHFFLQDWIRKPVADLIVSKALQ